MPQGKSGKLPALAALLVAVCLWGLAPVATRFLVMDISPMTLMVVRFTMVALLFLGILARFRVKNWKRSDLGLIIFCGLVGVTGYNLPIAIGLQWVPASLGGLLNATIPLWLALISFVFLHEKITGRVLLGFSLSITGVILLVGKGNLAGTGGDRLVWGALLILLGGLMWAIYTLAVKALSRRYGAIASTGLTYLIGSLPLIFCWNPALVELSTHLDGTQWLALALLALGSSVIGTILWNFGLGRIPSAQAGLFMYLIPVVSFICGIVLLGEQPSLFTVFSGVIVMAGVIVAQLP
jgi:drug/metabolite transporter (DMT)-like permease